MDIKIKKRKQNKRRVTMAVILLAIMTGCIMSSKPKSIIRMTPMKKEVIPSSEKTTVVSLLQSDKANALEITDEEVREMVKKAVDLAGGLDRIVSDGDTVVLKVNMISAAEFTGGVLAATGSGFDINNPFPEERRLRQKANGMSTDYRITKAVAEIVRELNPSGKIYVMELSGSGMTDLVYDILGYTHENIPQVDEFIAMDKTGENYAAGDTSDLVAVDLGDKARYKDFATYDKLKHLGGIHYMNKTYYEADVIIDLPVLKSHINAGMTGAVKNVAIGSAPAILYGTSGPDGGNANRFEIDHSFEALHQFMHDYYLVKPVDFVITDGLAGSQFGPVGQGAPSYDEALKNMRLILAGKDAVAVDTIHSLIVGVDPEKILCLKYLAEEGVGIIDTSRIDVVGNRKVEDVREKFKFAGIPFKWMFPEPPKTPYEDYKGPDIVVSDFSLSGDALKLSVSSDEGISKMEILSSDTVVGIVRKKGKHVDINMTLAESMDLSLLVYDRLMNTTLQKL